MRLAARIAGIGLVGPGLASWSAARETLAGRAPYASSPTRVPAPEALPATERRRAGKCVKLALATGLEAVQAAGVAPAGLAAIFASSSGDGENCHAICETLASADRLISPTRFHNSVHNAPAGYWSIATGATASIDCLGAYDASFGAGLLEALTRLAVEPAAPVVLVAYDAPYPEPLNGARPIADAFGVAFVLEPANGAGPSITLGFTREPEQPAGEAGLEAMRRTIPAARSLPLLELLARDASGSATLAYLAGLNLRVEVVQ
jgi:hypothetical protein